MVEALGVFVDALLLVAEARAAVALPTPQGFEPGQDPFAHLTSPLARTVTPGSGGDTAMADAEGAAATTTPNAVPTGGADAAAAATSLTATAKAADGVQVPAAASTGAVAMDAQPAGAEAGSQPSSQDLPAGQQQAAPRAADGGVGMAALAGQGFGQGFWGFDGTPPYPAVLAEVVSRVLHCCYSELWQTRMGAVLALQLLIDRCAHSVRGCPACH